MLLLEPNRVVSADRLIDALWDGESPPTARRQLHNAIAALRRGLGPQKSVVVKDGPGYRVEVDPHDIDARRFTTRLTKAAAAAAERRFADAITLLEQGLGLWQGPALAGLTGSVLGIAAAKLEEKRLGATEQLLALRLERGDASSDLVPQLGELVSEHPLREEARRLLMLALHGSGRKADALNVYEQGRRLLREDLGVDPGMTLRRLYEQILRDDVATPGPRRDIPTPGEDPRRRGRTRDPAPARRSYLPYDTAHFTGRVTELRSLSWSPAAADTALGIVAIDGMAGVGKTTLAVRLAHQVAPSYAEAQLFIDLHGHTPGQEPLEPGAALERLLLDLGVPPAEIPADERQRAAFWRAEVSERPILLVLDNALDVGQVRPLLPGTGKARVIITSRRRLVGLDGVRACSLDVFDPADGARLFTTIAGGDRLGHRPEVLREVLDLCGHLPLAISIAASRLLNRPAWTLDDLVLRLRDEDRRLTELSLGDRSLVAPFDASYRDLPALHRTLLFRLGFTTAPGEDFDAEVAAAMTDVSPAEADRLLDDLFDVHLLRQRSAGHYHFHELLRLFACTRNVADLGGTLTLPAAGPASGLRIPAS